MLPKNQAWSIIGHCNPFEKLARICGGVFAYFKVVSTYWHDILGSHFIWHFPTVQIKAPANDLPIGKVCFVSNDKYLCSCTSATVLLVPLLQVIKGPLVYIEELGSLQGQPGIAHTGNVKHQDNRNMPGETRNWRKLVTNVTRYIIGYHANFSIAFNFKTQVRDGYFNGWLFKSKW